MPRSTLTSKGQVTIPKQVRDHLGLKMGDRLLFEIEDGGRLVVRLEERDPLGALPGLLRHLARDRPLSIAEMHEGIAQHLAEKLGPKAPR
jgi:antitoxin PrlF